MQKSEERERPTLFVLFSFLLRDPAANMNPPIPTSYVVQVREAPSPSMAAAAVPTITTTYRFQVQAGGSMFTDENLVGESFRKRGEFVPPPEYVVGGSRTSLF